MTLRLYRAAKNRAMSVYHVAAMLVYAAAATDRAERPKARWTGMLRVPGLSSATRGRSVHFVSSPCAMSSGSSNVISMFPSVIISRHGSFTRSLPEPL